MSCSCLKNQNRDGVSISPYDFCPFCAEKHLSTAYAEFQNSGSRQLIMGELKLCKMHMNGKSDFQGKLQSLIDDRIMTTTILVLENLIEELNTLIESEIDEQKNGQDRKLSGSIEMVNVPDTSDMKLSELNFCTAWRLAEECGYMVLNRSLIISSLTLSQLYCYRLNYALAVELRDIRHLIQYRRESEIGGKWQEIAGKFEDLLK